MMINLGPPEKFDKTYQWWLSTLATWNQLLKKRLGDLKEIEKKEEEGKDSVEDLVFHKSRIHSRQALWPQKAQSRIFHFNGSLGLEYRAHTILNPELDWSSIWTWNQTWTQVQLEGVQTWNQVHFEGNQSLISSSIWTSSNLNSSSIHSQSWTQAQTTNSGWSEPQPSYDCKNYHWIHLKWKIFRVLSM